MRMDNKKPSAYDIKKALAKRHKEDLFFTEVKDGPTQIVAHHAKIDALAIKISWTQYSITGYEIKVARSDFLRDEKWCAYLQMCNQLYFAVAPGICDVSEVPDVCGLVQYTPKGGLRTVKKAPWREIEHPISMYQYLMFNYIGTLYKRDSEASRHERLLREDRVEIFRKYLEDKSDLSELGRRVSRKMRDELSELRNAACNLKRLQEQEVRADKQLAVICKALGVSSLYDSDRVGKCLKEIEQIKQSGGITFATINRIKQINLLTEQLVAELTSEEPKNDYGG